MKANSNQVKLETELKRLEASAQKIVSTRGYTNEVERMKILSELLKEQLRNENSNNTARSIR